MNNKPEKYFDKVLNMEYESCSCAVCQKCWKVSKGPYKGICLYGGPFSGYEHVKTNK